MTDSPNTIRFKFDTTPVLKRALQLRAFLDDVDLQNVVNASLSKYLAEQIDEVVSRGMVREPEINEEMPNITQRSNDDEHQHTRGCPSRQSRNR